MAWVVQTLSQGNLRCVTNLCPRKNQAAITTLKRLTNCHQMKFCLAGQR